MKISQRVWKSLQRQRSRLQICLRPMLVALFWTGAKLKLCAVRSAITKTARPKTCRLRGQAGEIRRARVTLRMRKQEGEKRWKGEKPENDACFYICFNLTQLREVPCFHPIHSDMNNKHSNEVINLQHIMQLTKESFYSPAEVWIHVLKALYLGHRSVSGQGKSFITRICRKYVAVSGSARHRKRDTWKRNIVGLILHKVQSGEL